MPQRERHATVIYIPKPGKANYDQIRSFRPITLACSCLKLQERLISWHLEALTPKKVKPVHDHQYAFRRNSGTEDALSKVTPFIEKYIYSNQLVLGLFVDITGDFDFVLVDQVTQAMKAKGVPKKVIKWYEFFLKNRTI